MVSLRDSPIPGIGFEKGILAEGDPPGFALEFFLELTGLVVEVADHGQLVKLWDAESWQEVRNLIRIFSKLWNSCILLILISRCCRC